MSQPLGRVLALAPGARVAVVGCGGKTSAIEGLAAGQPPGYRVLVAPTTKIRMPGSDRRVYQGAAEALAGAACPGVQYAGVRADGGGKLAGLPPEVLAALAPRYDLLLMEADGSRGLPCKGWAGHEPLVPAFATHTLGVVLLRALGRRADAEAVHRLPLFLQLTGLVAGEEITMDALAKMVGAPGGMLSAARGKVVLLVNGVTDENWLEKAEALARAVRCLVPDVTVLAGDTRADLWQPLP